MHPTRFVYPWQTLPTRPALTVILFLAWLANAQQHYWLYKPDPYFPAFPGSSWTFVNDKGDTSSLTVAERYVPVLPALYTPSHCTALGKWMFVPMLSIPQYGGWFGGLSMKDQKDGRWYQPIVNNNVIKMVGPAGPTCATLVPFLQHSLGARWVVDSETRCNERCQQKRVSAIDTTITVLGRTFDSVLVVQYYDAGKWQLDYFSKGIGLVLREAWSDTGAQAALIGRLSLLDFRINRSALETQIIRIDSLIPPPPTVEFGPSGISGSIGTWGNWWHHGLPNTSATGEILSELRFGGLDQPIHYYIPKPTGDTVRLMAHTTSGQKPDLQVGGHGTKISDESFLLPWKEGITDIAVNSEAFAYYHAAEPFRGRICMIPMPQVSQVVPSSGQVELSASTEEAGYWQYQGLNTAFPDIWQDLPASGRPVWNPDRTGFYRFMLVRTTKVPGCEGEPIFSRKVEVRTVTAVPAPHKDIRFIRFGNAPLSISLPFPIDPSIDLSLLRSDGRRAGLGSIQLRESSVEVGLPSGLERGIYLLKACRNGTCLSWRVPFL